LQQALQNLSKQLTGDFFYDDLMRKIYATDASVYREMPLAVAYPKTKDDLKKLIHFATENNTSLIPRTAGTSLAGQCVGNGIVVDFSKHFFQILEVNTTENWTRVQPGVIRNQLNHFVKSDGLFFGPNTSTANRAMIGGMVANNSCGSYSIVYGATIDHVLELKCLLSDGSEAIFKKVDEKTFQVKQTGVRLINKIYQQAAQVLSNKENAHQIKTEYPKPTVTRRNTGYALDALLQSYQNKENGGFDFCKLITGSEGTLCLITEIKINLDPLPPKHIQLIAAHFNTIKQTLNAVPKIMQHQPRAVEMMDKIVLDCTKESLKYKPYRFFVQDDPEGILIIEVGANSADELKQKTNAIIEELQRENLGYAYPIIKSEEKIEKVWALRSAGLGLLANVPGDAKAVAIIEDTAVDVNDLPAYIDEVTALLKQYNQRMVYYAHAGAGELHLRPILDLKKENDRQLFEEIGTETAKIVKKYKGSMSGEHGDGRVRAQFIPTIIGQHNYKLCKQIKQLWDPKNIFNPGKIVDAKPMLSNLRYEANQKTPTIKTAFDFSGTQGIIRATEKCNGSGDCRKLAFSGGTMCPSYMATRNEKDSTRARANLLREVLSNSNKANRFDSEELKEVLDLCLSCKGCTSECPSNVDMPTLKSEFLYHYYKANGIPLSARLTANLNFFNQIFSIAPSFNNMVMQNPVTAGLMKKILGLHSKRKMPLLHKTTVLKWFKKNKAQLKAAKPIKGKVLFLADEFTNFNDAHIGIKAIMLLLQLGYEVEVPGNYDSGRAQISMGLLDSAKRIANKNVKVLSKMVNSNLQMIGVEPPSVLPFREEYPKLVNIDLKETSIELGKNILLIDEFLINEIEKGNITENDFNDKEASIIIQGHCHHKALVDINLTKQFLSLPKNYEAELIPSGCCGMAGFFGYEKNHYEMSMEIGELILFPTVRKADTKTIIAATGASCRTQIEDGTQRKALHPIEVLYDALD